MLLTNMVVIFPDLLCNTFADRFVLTEPYLDDEIPVAHLSHKERYEQSVRKGTIVMDKLRRLMTKHSADDVRENYM